MSGYRGGRGAGRGGGGSAKPRGQFIKGVWHCDCTPGLPAVHLQTKKEGPNKGRWFRICQKEQGDSSRCKFFLWDSDAAPREARALASNSRTEPEHANETTPSRPRPQKAVSPPPPYTPQGGAFEPSRKRGRPAIEEDADEFGLEAGDADFNDELDQVMAAAETPRKTPRTDTFTTPARRRLPWQKDDNPRADGLQTPQTDHRVPTDPFTTRFAAPGGSLLTPSMARQREDRTPQTLTPASSPMDTPTPSRFKDVGNVTGDDIVHDVFGVLRAANVKLSEQATSDLSAVLSKHATVSEGIKKGRDVTRKLIRAKDAKITELTYRVNTLVAELEAEKAMVKHLQWEAGNEHQSD